MRKSVSLPLTAAVLEQKEYIDKQENCCYGAPDIYMNAAFRCHS